MAGSNTIEQFLHENISWKSMLYLFSQENCFLKTRLSEVVDKETDTIFIAHAEQFQNEFILKDEFILDIKNDIAAQEKVLVTMLTQKIMADKKICQKQEKLRNEISNLEKEFYTLKNHFNKYLLSMV